MKDTLYLLRPGFFNAGVGPLYCGDSLPVEGLLSFFPRLRTLLEVHYLEFPRPRAALVETLGEEHQGIPVLILADEREITDAEHSPLSVRAVLAPGSGLMENGTRSRARVPPTENALTSGFEMADETMTRPVMPQSCVGDRSTPIPRATVNHQTGGADL
jgi:hypothetical protein